MSRGGESDSRRAGLEAERRAIAAACKRRGWRLIEDVEEAGFSAEEPQRPRIEQAPRLLEQAGAKALLAAKQDQPGRLLLDLSRLIASAHKQGWALVALDCTPEPTPPPGSLSRAWSRASRTPSDG